MGGAVTATVAIPVLDEEAHIGSCLDAVDAQVGAAVVEVLVLDGGSSDRTPAMAASHPLVKVVPNPGRRQSAAMNLAIASARGDVLVRVDARTRIGPTYVRDCIEVLERTGAALVGGAQLARGDGWRQRGIAAALNSTACGGPAAFRRRGRSGVVDTVYLGAFRPSVARGVGGYDESTGVNEDAQFARRMSRAGSVWLDERISSTYEPRETFVGLARQYWSYGRGRATTVSRDLASLHPRQLAAPALVAGLVSPRRHLVAPAYAAFVVANAAGVARREDVTVASAYAVALPILHLTWGSAFFFELALRAGRAVSMFGRRAG